MIIITITTIIITTIITMTITITIYIVCFKVSVIKAKLHEEIGMPAGKQKLQLEVRVETAFGLVIKNIA
jgi:hypothetical protein